MSIKTNLNEKNKYSKSMNHMRRREGRQFSSIKKDKHSQKDTTRQTQNLRRFFFAFVVVAVKKCKFINKD